VPVSQPVQVRYGWDVEGGLDEGGIRIEVDVIADGTERSRTRITLFAEPAAPADETIVTILDGERGLAYSDSAESPYTVVEAPEEHPGDFPLFLRGVLEPGSDQFHQVCPDARRHGAATIAGRDAVGYTCRWADRDESLPQPKTLWLDAAITGLILKYGFYEAQKVILDPVVDESTFSTRPPAGADVEVIKARGTGRPSAVESDGEEPAPGPEAELRRIAATSATPIYYLGAEFAGEVLSDLVIFNDDTGGQAEGDHSLDPGQSLSIGYGQACDGDTCSPRFEVGTERFVPDRYRRAVGCHRLPSLRGVPTVQQSDAVWLFTDSFVVRLGGTADAPKVASAAASALREAGQEQPTGADLPAPPARIAALVGRACGVEPGDRRPVAEN
jgi:hypothetical protein